MASSNLPVHDRFFKQIFSRTETLRDFIKTYLPSGIVTHLDLDDLQVESGSFVDDHLSEYFSDILVKTRVSSGHPAEIYFLFEHKSGPERYARVQILQYMAGSWSNLIREGGRGARPFPLIM